MLGGLVVYLKKSHPFPRTYSLSVVFPNAQGVEAGAPVKMAGFSIGTVDQVTLEGQQANVVLHIQEETKDRMHNRWRSLHAASKVRS